MADLTRKTENLFDVLDYTDIQTSINGGASNVVKTSSTISFKSNGENDYSGIYIPATYFTAHINDYDVSTTYTLSADVYTDVPCTIIFGGSATIVSIPAGTSRLSYRFSGNITLAFYIRNTTANITLSKIMFAINDTTYEPYYPHSLRKLTTATEAVENPLYSDGTAITSYTIKGNTVQSGTPTPSNPVEVNGVGVRTENLWGETSTTNQYIDNQGNTGTNPNGDVYSLKTFTVSPSTTYTFSWSGFTVGNDNNLPYIRICFYTSNGGTFISRTLVNPNDYLDKYVSFTIPNNCTYVDIRIDSEASTRGQHFDNLMLNTGSTAKPYEPYGYKIPISSGQQTIDIYIGDLPLLKSLDATAVDEISNGILTRRVDSDGSVLPTPTTTQITMPSIPTTEGANSITVDTTVQPSEFTATWTGWHNATVKEYEGGVGNNKFDEQYPDIKFDVTYRPLYVGSGEFTCTSTCPQSQYGAQLFILAGNVSSGASTNTNGVWSGAVRKATAVDGYVTIAYRNAGGVSPSDYDTMLNVGSTALPYEPYEYGWE